MCTIVKFFSKVNVTLSIVFNNTKTLFTPLCALIIHMQDNFFFNL